MSSPSVQAKPTRGAKLFLSAMKPPRGTPFVPTCTRLPRGHVVNVRSIRGIDRRRVVFVTQTGVECQPRSDAETIVEKEVVAVRAEVLRVIDASDAGQQGKAEQQVRQRVAGDLRERRKLQAAARLDVTKGVLLREADVGAELDQMTAAAHNSPYRESDRRWLRCFEGCCLRHQAAKNPSR